MSYWRKSETVHSIFTGRLLIEPSKWASEHESKWLQHWILLARFCPLSCCEWTVSTSLCVSMLSPKTILGTLTWETTWHTQRCMDRTAELALCWVAAWTNCFLINTMLQAVATISQCPKWNLSNHLFSAMMKCIISHYKFKLILLI